MPNDKKRKRDGSKPTTTPATNGHTQSETIDTSKPSAVFQPRGPRAWTVSLALPSSIIANAKNLSLKTYMAGSIARALAVFCVDEIVLFSDEPSTTPAQQDSSTATFTAFSDPTHFLAQLLSYLETPAHLRSRLFGMHDNLRKAGELPSLDMPHHLRRDEACAYREGITLFADQSGTYVDVGLTEPRLLPSVQIPSHTRVTVKLSSDEKNAEAVAPSDPRTQAGYYWGYAVRTCPSLSAVLTECPFDGGYDVSIGTSERGRPLNEILSDAAEIPPFNHLLLVLGGVAGLETAAANDKALRKMGVGGTNVGDLFDYWVDLCPGQGSRTIRTEEAVWLGLMGVRRLVERR